MNLRGHKCPVHSTFLLPLIPRCPSPVALLLCGNCLRWPSWRVLLRDGSSLGGGSVLRPVLASSKHHPLDILLALKAPMTISVLTAPNNQATLSLPTFRPTPPNTTGCTYFPSLPQLLSSSQVFCLCWWHHTHPTSQIQGVEVIRELSSTPHSQQSSLGICPFPSIPVVRPSSSLSQIIAATS